MPELPLLEPPYRLAVTIFRDSIRAFADGDCELARTLKLKDRELDGLTDTVSQTLVQRATLDAELVPSYVDLIFVARVLERIGDHATNIAEDSLQEALVVADPRSPVADGVIAPSTDRIKWIGASPLFEYGTCRRFQGFADRQKVSQMS